MESCHLTFPQAAKLRIRIEQRVNLAGSDIDLYDVLRRRRRFPNTEKRLAEGTASGNEVLCRKNTRRTTVTRRPSVKRRQASSRPLASEDQQLLGAFAPPEGKEIAVILACARIGLAVLGRLLSAKGVRYPAIRPAVRSVPRPCGPSWASLRAARDQPHSNGRSRPAVLIGLRRTERR